MKSSSDASVVERAQRVVESSPGQLLAVVGPTASGKTGLAVALAERIAGEIVSADSVQVYRGFDIGSGKPTTEEMARAPHHLVGVLDPNDDINAADWASRARATIDEIRARGKTPILCGGTFLWVKALLFGLAGVPAASAAIRRRHAEMVDACGRSALHGQLRAVDPVTAARLHPNDFVRVSRALEVHELSGRPMSEWHREHADGLALSTVPAKLVALRHDSPALTKRIEARVDSWLRSGWIEEVERLDRAGYGDARAMRSVGYTQIRSMLAGHLDRAALALAIVRATRTFARRQRTWLNHVDVTWLDAEEAQ
jgi:tRNA dimethylallyltransferase